MGLVYNNFRVLLNARRGGASFQRTLTIGRQQIFVSAAEVCRLAREFPEFSIDAQNVPPSGAYCEPWLRSWLGAEAVESIDFSAYEGATIVHDMNAAIESAWEGMFTAVIDGGSLEHIYFLTVAIANVMRMTAVGGWLFVATVANNHCGHGFYQLSPEWFFRTFSPDNGFEVGEVLLMPHPYPGAELSENHCLYQVTDPRLHGGRVGLVGDRPVMILASARRNAVCELFRQAPQQSDYSEMWSQDSVAAQEDSVMQLPKRLTIRRIVGATRRYLQQALPTPIQRRLQGRSQRRAYALSNRQVFTPWVPSPLPKREDDRSSPSNA